MLKLVKPNRALETIDDEEKALLARALREAADRHINPHGVDGYDFHADAEVGNQMIALAAELFPYEAVASSRAETLKKALALGFMPPPDGDILFAAEVFLGFQAPDRRGKSVAPRYQPTQADLDEMPF